MTATRRRGYTQKDKYPVIEVFHPDAWMYKVVSTSTRQELFFSITRETNGNIAKIIVDDNVYEGSSISEISDGTKITVPTGDHTIYVYFTSNNVSGVYSDLGNNKIIPYAMRSSRNNTRDYLGCYYPGNCTYYLCCNTVLYPYNAHKGYFNKNNTHIYVPVDMQKPYLTHATWQERGMTEENIIAVKYKFIEDE